ncbi:MAG: sterol desaturase family protein [Calditrichaeota bacterium]|nr:sterol desaturase family protein [Calditrichota bacterium]
METFVNFFENIPTVYRTAILVSGLFIFWMMEGIIPLSKISYKRYKHAALNIFFMLTTVIVNLGFAFFLVRTSEYVAENQVGFLYVVVLPLWLKIIIGLLLMDLISAYLIHWILHKVKWMWKFHIIHHTDTKVDVTTSLRAHPGESVFRFVFTIIAVMVSGAPIGIVMIYQSMSAMLSQFNHANISLPAKLDMLLSYILVSPNMHKVHHHFKQPLTDTNYGNIFSVWDRLFNTFASVDNPEQELVYGLDTHMESREHENIAILLAIPFKKYRPPLNAKFGSEKNSAGKNLS